MQIWIVNSIFYFIFQLLLLPVVAQSNSGELPKSGGDNLQTAYISGSWEGLTDGNITLELYNENYLSEYEAKLIPPSIFSSRVKNGEFSFSINGIKSPSYFVIKKWKNSTENDLMVFDHIIEENDSIQMLKKNGIVSFSGNGAEKYKIRQCLSSDYLVLERSLFPIKPEMDAMESLLRLFKTADSIRKIQASYLEEKRHLLSKKVYNILQADIYGKAQSQPMYAIGLEIMGTGRIKYSDRYNLNKIQSWVETYIKEIENIPEQDAALSKEYIYFLFKKEQVNQLLSENKRSYYTSFKQNYHALLRDKLLAMTIIQGYKYLKNTDSLVNDALAIFENPEYRRIITSLHNEQKVGAVAPMFSLPDTANTTISLGDFKGKVVFIDFW